MGKVNVIHNGLIGSLASEEKRLSVVVSTDGLYSFIQNQELPKYKISYAKINSEEEQLDYIKELSNEMTFSSINIFYDTSYFTLLPRSMFLYGKEKSYCRNIFPVRKTDVFFSDQLPSNKAVNIYCYSLEQDVALRQGYPGVRTSHILSSLVEKESLHTENSAFLYLMESHFYIVMKKAGQLTLATRIAVNDETNILYHLSKIIEDQNFFGSIILGGFIGPDSLLQDSLAKYHSQVELFSSELYINATCIFN